MDCTGQHSCVADFVEVEFDLTEVDEGDHGCGRRAIRVFCKGIYLDSKSEPGDFSADESSGAATATDI
ncbi:MAG: hypothetical protein ONB32_13460 [candidate division KSB1 bacterium]|nr:hypothetical protein [candidate division KSB1 bacterium]